MSHSKGDKVINPKTGRMITVGSQVWKQLASQGMLEPSYKVEPKEKPVKENMMTREKSQEDSESSEEDLVEIEKQLSEILKQQQESNENVASYKKKAGRPKKAKYEAKKIEVESSSSSESEVSP